MRNETLEPRRIHHRHSDNRMHDLGASLVEYALLLALIAVACIAALTAFGSATSDSYGRSGDSIIAAN